MLRIQMASCIEFWPLDRFLPPARNARANSEDQVAQIAASICEFGFVNPILAGPDRVIIAGHARLLAARKLGLNEAPVIVIDELNENQRRALALADNRLPLNGAWDGEMFRLEIEALHHVECDLDNPFDALSRERPSGGPNTFELPKALEDVCR